MKIAKPFCGLALVLLSLQAFSAQAGDEIGNNWLSIIQGLESRGITQVGIFRTGEFRKKAGRVNWRALNEAPPSLIAGARQTAFYYKPSRTIFVDTSSFGADARVGLPQLELHELLGVTGYDDSSYQSSMALVEIAGAPSAAEAARLRNLYAGSIFSSGSIAARNAPQDLPVALRSGSGTSIGGGGDLNMVNVKAQVLRLVKSWGGVGNDFLVAYPNVAFEPLSSPEARNVVLEYKWEAQARTKKGYREWFTVYVPVGRWQEGASAQASIIEEIAHKITAIFPAHGGGQTVTFTPPGCPASVQVTYPYTQFPDVAALQRDRAMYINQCLAAKLESASSISRDFPRGGEPRKSGTFYYQCAFSHAQIGMQPYTVETQSILGRSETKSLGVGWEGSYYLAGMAQISRQGEIESLAIAYKKNKEDPMEAPRFTRAQSPTEGSTEMMIDGSPLRFSCRRK